MKIAVTYQNGMIFQHFGRTEQFKIYDVEDGVVVGSRVVDTNGQGHGALAGFLAEEQVDVLICGGIGGGAQMALAEAGIRLCGGVSGLADMAVSAYLGGTLAYSSDEVRTDAPPSPTTYQIINRRACAERILWIKEIRIDEGGVSGAAYTSRLTAHHRFRIASDASALNAAGIDSFFPILRSVCTLEEAMDSETAYANLAAAAEQIFRLL